MRMLEQTRERFDTSIGITSAGLALSGSSEFFTTIIDELVTPIKQRFANYIERGQRQGVFRKPLDANHLFDTILGSMVACEALGSAKGKTWTQKTTDLVWPAIAA